MPSSIGLLSSGLLPSCPLLRSYPNPGEGDGDATFTQLQDVAVTSWQLARIKAWHNRILPKTSSNAGECLWCMDVMKTGLATWYADPAHEHSKRLACH